jgi:hypothetical protein
MYTRASSHHYCEEQLLAFSKIPFRLLRLSFSVANLPSCDDSCSTWLSIDTIFCFCFCRKRLCADLFFSCRGQWADGWMVRQLEVQQDVMLGCWGMTAPPGCDLWCRHSTYQLTKACTAAAMRAVRILASWSPGILVSLRHVHQVYNGALTVDQAPAHACQDYGVQPSALTCTVMGRRCVCVSSASEWLGDELCTG